MFFELHLDEILVELVPLDDQFHEALLTSCEKDDQRYLLLEYREISHQITNYEALVS